MSSDKKYYRSQLKKITLYQDQVKFLCFRNKSYKMYSLLFDTHL